MRKHENRRWLKLLAVGIFAYCCTCKCAYSTEVSSSEAQEAVRGWVTLRAALADDGRFAVAVISSVATYMGRDGEGVFYVISFESGGYAVTSGDTEVTPILAYSEEGEFVAGEENPLWVMLTQDVAGRTKRLGNGEQGTGNGIATRGAKTPSANASAWARLREASQAKPLLRAALPRQSSVADLRAGPLCETKWSQGDVAGGHCYNYYTPSNLVCGCVATAFAQIMRHFEWPRTKVEIGDHWYHRFVVLDSGNVDWQFGTDPGSGTVYGLPDVFTGPDFGGPYDWANMPANPTAVGLTETQRQAIGRLTRDCGISVHMKYASGGSSSRGSLVKLRLVDQFGYANAEIIHAGSAQAQRDAMLASFDLGSPCAVSIPGHEIVADGYGYSDERLYIHFNWGWGDRSENAWYTPPDDSESDTEYPTVQHVIYNIYTPETCTEAGRTVVSGRVLDEEGEPVAGTVVTAADRKNGDARFSATTNERGVYALLLPPDATYSIAAESSGKTAKTFRRVDRCLSNRIYEEESEISVNGSVANIPNVELQLTAAVVSEDKWIEESSSSREWSGEWSDGIEYGDNGRAYLYGSNSFTPFSASTGNVVTVEFKARFDEVTIPEDPGANAQAAVRLSTNGCFQVWTNGWVDVAADGVTPVSGAEYTFRTILNYGERTYSVDVLSSGNYLPMVGRVIPNAPNGGLGTSRPTSFPLASASNAVSRVVFKGETQFTSLVGDSRYEIIGFAADDALVLSNNVQIVLDAAKAAWLNSCAGGRDALVASAAGLSAKELNDAYLLNLDITDGERSYAFAITDVDVGAETVTVSVTLTRNGALMDATSASLPINGVLKFYGAATLEEFKTATAPLSSQTLVDDDFSDGDTATATFPKGDNVFFKAKIEGP